MLFNARRKMVACEVECFLLRNSSLAPTPV